MVARQALAKQKAESVASQACMLAAAITSLRTGREMRGNMPSGACGERKAPVWYGPLAPVRREPASLRGEAQAELSGAQGVPAHGSPTADPT